MHDKPETVMCTYRVRESREAEFQELLRRHHPKLLELGLVTDTPSMLFRGVDAKVRPYVIEIFEWKSAAATQRAHEHPEVMAIWEPMDELCESRDGLPNMEFPHLERLEL